MTLPETADAVIVGGGILGLSAAWHLTRSHAGMPHAGMRVLVLERNGLATAATAQAAALMTSARPDAATAALVADTYAAIPRLEEETGESLDLNRVGTLHVAGTPATAAALAGMTGERLDGAAAVRLAPWLDADAVAAARFVPEDGYLDPARLANAYAHAARRRGAVIRTGVDVRRLTTAAGRVTGVETADRGHVSAPAVVLACGAWSNVLAATAGAGLPAAPVRSEYWITERAPRLCPHTAPVTVLPDAGAYARPELGALLFGLRGATTLAADPRTLPDDTTGFMAGDPWETLAAGADRLMRLVPSVGALGIAHYIAGLSTYTPDGTFVVGAVPGVAGLAAVTGCCGAGIAASSGLGRAVAAVVQGQAPWVDLSPFDPGRFGTVDPFDPAFLSRCAAARSGKTSG